MMGVLFSLLMEAKLIFRASRPKTATEAIKEYQDLLADGLGRAYRNGTIYLQCGRFRHDVNSPFWVTRTGVRSFILREKKVLVSSSNFEAERGFPFNLYLIDLDGKNLESV